MTAMAPAAWQVARAKASEAEVYSELYGRCFDASWPAADFSAFAIDPGCIVFGARAAGQLAGLIVCRCAVDEAEIITLAVAGGSRRRGIARALWESARGELAQMGVARVVLEVAANNEAALGLYRTLGFAEVGVRRRYYASGAQDARVMAITLAD
jgi:ribosomal-protein-alanine N-acetyltransferase